MRLSEVHAEPIDWLWTGRLAKGFFTIFEGDPGVGKGFLTMDLAARVTRGWAMPGEPGDNPLFEARRQVRPPATVVLVTSEDSRARTEVPRADAAGADLTKLIALSGLDQFGRDITGVAEALVQAIGHELDTNSNVGLIILDPIEEALPGLTDYNASSARLALSVLINYARTSEAAMLAVRHLTKGPAQSPMYRGRGSIALTAASRMVYLLAPDPAAPGTKVLAPIKNNLCEAVPSTSFYLSPRTGYSQPVAVWQGETPLSAADIASAPQSGPVAVGRAEAFLVEELRNGPLSLSQLLSRASKFGISEGSLWRAKTRLGITSTQGSEKGIRKWLWNLPDEPEPKPEEPPKPSITAAAFLIAFLADGPKPAPEITKAAAEAGIPTEDLWKAKSELNVIGDPVWRLDPYGAE